MQRSGTARVPQTKVRPPAPVGIERARLTRRVIEPPAGVRIVTGPAGAGKSTLLAHAAHRWPGRVVWASLDDSDRGPEALTGTLAAAALVEDADGPLDVVAALDDGADTLLVLDDVHELAGSVSMRELRLLQRYRPPQVTVVIGARHLQDLERWRWAATDDLRVIDADALRFRVWEVDEMFRVHFEAPLSPQDLHTLTTRTAGWAVALHLFHIATRRSPESVAEQIGRSGRVTHRSIREYIREQVLATVSMDDRAFLRRVAVLDHLDATRCERLVAHGPDDGPPADAAVRLERLAAIGLLQPEPERTSFGMHDLLRAHLLTELSEELGVDGANDWHRRAATVLEHAGAFTDAVRAASRAGDWPAVARLLAVSGGEPMPTDWLDDVPAALRLRDPWMLRADGIARLRDGDLEGARRRMHEAVALFAESGGERASEHITQRLDAWYDPPPGQLHNWVAALRRALDGEDAGPSGTTRHDRLVRGVVALAGARFAIARRELGSVLDEPGDEVAAVARVGLLVTDHFAGTVDNDRVQQARLAARDADLTVLEAVIDAISGAPARASELLAAVESRRERSDRHGAAFLAVWAGLWSVPGTEESRAALDEARAGAATLGIGVVDQLLAVGELRQARAQGGSRRPSERSTHLLGRALELLAGDDADRAHARTLAESNGFVGWLEAVAGEIVIDLRTRPPNPAAGPADAGSGLAVRVLGPVKVTLDGKPQLLDDLRPRHLELLHALALRPNDWVHREVLCSWFWPDKDVRSATRNLQTAVSAVRKAIEPDAGRGESTVLTRSGGRYRLAVDPEQCDLCRFEDRIRRALHASQEGSVADAVAHLAAAVVEWHGEPAAEDGPVEWAVERRTQLRAAFADAVMSVLADAVPDATTTALLGDAVRVEPHDDRLWRLALDHAGASGASAAHRALLDAYRRAVGEPSSGPVIDEPPRNEERAQA